VWTLLWLFVTSSAYGQTIAPAPPTFDAPVVHKNGTVTFRISAPLAQATLCLAGPSRSMAFWSAMQSAIYGEKRMGATPGWRGGGIWRS
jgi:hypothetical protein